MAQKLDLFVALVCLLLNFSSTISSEEEVKNNESWKVAFKQVYSANQEQKISPEETLELLKGLKEHFGGITDPLAGGYYAGRIKDLIEASKVSESKCSYEDVKKRNYLHSIYWFYEAALIPYLKHYSELQLRACQQTLDKHLGAALTELNKSTKMEIEELEKYTFKTGQSLAVPLEKAYVREIPTILFNRAIASLISFRLKHYSSVVGSPKKSQFNHLFDINVEEPCKDVTEKLGPILTIYQSYFFGLKADDMNTDTFSDQVKKWLVDYNICTQILAKRREIRKESYKVLSPPSKLIPWPGFLQ